jgi:membrane protease YdiL (CAAX protease family)
MTPAGLPADARTASAEQAEPPDVTWNDAEVRTVRRYLLVAFTLAWLFAVPVWLSGKGVEWIGTVVCGAAMMAAPTLGVLAVRWPLRGRWRELARETGLTLGPRPRRTAALVALAWFGVPALVVLAVALSAALGVVRLDLHGFSYYAQQLGESTGGRPLGLSARTLVLLTVVQALTVGPGINTLFALGEELGWRGWMLPRLVETRGTTVALLLSGVIWGLWHFPLTLLGYNYPELGAWAAPFFIGFCVLFAVPIGWLRLTSGSVWPSAVAHAALNASAGLIVLVADVSTPPKLQYAGITGLVGWALLAGLAGLALANLRRHPPAVPVATEPAVAAVDS